MALRNPYFTRTDSVQAGRHAQRFHPRGDLLLTSIVTLSILVPRSTVPAQPTETIRVELKLQTGGAIAGAVVDHTDHGLVVVNKSTPYVFAWSELKPGSALGTKRALIVFERGSDELIASDYFDLGRFALMVDRSDVAALNFRRAQELDASLKPQVKASFEAYRTHKKNRKLTQQRLSVAASADQHGEASTQRETGPDSSHPEMGTRRVDTAVPVTTDLLAGRSDDVLAAYKKFGDKVTEVLGRSIVLVESEHFLIWTDWSKRYQGRLVLWAEAMYTALCSQFGLDPSGNIFLTKCPVFCFRSPQRFKKFAKYFDGYEAMDAIGYTRSIEANGHVHVALLRRGSSLADFDRFAYTLVHEGAHAFMHRLHSTKLIPHWVNEGVAEMTAERVLGDRCPAGENAQLLARQYARFGWPVVDFLRDHRPIEVHEYPLACSLIMHMETAGADRLTGFIRALKGGHSVSDALSRQYDGWTLAQLVEDWRMGYRQEDNVRSSVPNSQVPPHKSRKP